MTIEFMQRRDGPIDLIKYIGKESNSLEDVDAEISAGVGVILMKTRKANAKQAMLVKLVLAFALRGSDSPLPTRP
jgi:hypothetical protein